MKTKLVVVASQTGSRLPCVFNEHVTGTVWTLSHDGTSEGFAQALQKAIAVWQDRFCREYEISTGSQIIAFSVVDRQDFED